MKSNTLIFLIFFFTKLFSNEYKKQVLSALFLPFKYPLAISQLAKAVSGPLTTRVE